MEGIIENFQRVYLNNQNVFLIIFYDIHISFDQKDKCRLRKTYNTIN